MFQGYGGAKLIRPRNLGHEYGGTPGSGQGQEALAANEKALNRLTRTFAAQVEALKRYPSKGEQRVYVERVNVE